jgi:hypothetical protein
MRAPGGRRDFDKLLAGPQVAEREAVFGVPDPAAARKSSGRTLGRALESFLVSVHRIPTTLSAVLRVLYGDRMSAAEIAVQSDLPGLSPEALRLSQVANVT